MARLGGVCWSVCADLADSCGVARRDTAIAMVRVTVRRERTISGCNYSPATGLLHHPVAETAISSFDLLKRGAFS